MFVLRNLIGTVLSVEGRQVTIQPHHEDLHDPLPFMQHELQKAFKSSDHVKVTGGTFTGETGLVVKIDNDVIYIVSDHSMKEIKVKAKDVQLANEVSSGLDSLGQFELHELVQLDFRNVACIVRIDRDILVVLDQDGNDRQVHLPPFHDDHALVAHALAPILGQADLRPSNETFSTWHRNRS